MYRRLAAILLALLCALPVAAQLPPDKALKEFKVSDGLEITLWASEPMFVNPSCIDIDHKGRVWVCESVNYRMKLRGQTKMRRPEGDRILVLEDTKGAGKADKVTVFYQAPDVICPLGIACAPYPDGKGMKVYVCHSPHIYVFEDKDGDCKADGPPKILLTGFKGYDHDHGVHGILIGPDNKLYFSVGDQGVKDLQSSDGKGRKWTSNSTDCRAGTIWRCDLDGKNLELIAHNFRNNYEPCVDSFGTIFISDNDDDGLDQTRICYVMPGGNYGYHPRGKGQTHWHEEQPGVVPKVLRTFRGSPCGMCFYEGTLLPKKYWGQPLHVDAGPGRLSAYHLKPKGAGYDVEREDMVTSKDSYFRPSDVCVAPDGSVFICDWYDQGVGGHAVRNLEDGRIYRLAPKGNKPSVPSADVTSDARILEALGSPNLATRHIAAQAIKSMDAGRALALLLKESHREADVRLFARAFWLGHQLPDAEFVNFRFSFPLTDDPWSVMAVRALKDRHSDLSRLTPVLRKSLRTMSESYMKRPPRFLGEILLALRHSDPAFARDWILEIAKQYDGKDRFYLAAVGIAVGHSGISKEIDKRREIILADFDKHFPEWNDKVAGLVWELRPPGMVAMLEKHLKGGKLTPAQRGQIVDLLAGSSEEAAARVLLEMLGRTPDADLRARMLAHFSENLGGRWTFLRKDHAVDDLIVRALKGDAAARATGLDLLAALGKDRWIDEVKALAWSTKEPHSVRQAAVRALGGIRHADAMIALTQLMSDKGQRVELRVAAAQGLGRDATWISVPAFQKAIVHPEAYPLEVRQTALAALAFHKGGSGLLLQFYKDKELPADLVADVTRLLRNSPFPEVRKAAQQVLPQPPKLDPKNLPSIPALLARKGNVDRGRELMLATQKNEAQCMRCHTIQGTGGQIGPDLTTIGSKASRENLLESILYPSRAISHQYDSWVVETKGGLAVTGLIVEEMPDHYVLRDATGKDFKIAKKEIDTKVKSPTSLMPDNLLVHIPEEDLVDMVEYLYSLKNPGPVPTGRLSPCNEKEEWFTLRARLPLAAPRPSCERHASAKRKPAIPS